MRRPVDHVYGPARPWPNDTYCALGEHVFHDGVCVLCGSGRNADSVEGEAL